MEFVVTRVHAIANGIGVTAVKDRQNRLHFQGTEQLSKADRDWVHRRLAVMLRKFDVQWSTDASR